MNILEQMLSKYEIESENDMINALKEIFQEIVLLGLYRGGFFEKAAFYGGTALRILYGLDRFSEDLDFTLLEKNKNFKLEPYFPVIIEEFNSLGISINIHTKKKSSNISHIESAFLKNDTSLHSLHISSENISSILGGIYSGRKIKIKFEIDTNPPLKFQTESKTLLMPITFNILSMSLPNLYAGKMHAVLFRNWKTRVKGRDWYDFEWYVKQGVKLNLEHLQHRIIESENLDSAFVLTKEVFIEFMYKKVDQLNIKNAVTEVSPFLKDTSVLGAWTKDYFRFLTGKIIYC
ncbi:MULTISPECIES: nucleotidyl transferase AbiEii/AbiGii toxin family protein [unclassified Lentimicrobium]|uniref:nucleotidyl transferase AbiEii/AbiGii toxin family protein n=1 Tax=unclassified Lentimicrobium TaxID=2677434 RepID=UPI0020A69B93|nr:MULTISPECIES: nucleotidyl transferase AbiEii/AbiGii toxin family protein [unclassified Lentimicrobium]